jgi:hypothetical protein
LTDLTAPAPTAREEEVKRQRNTPNEEDHHNVQKNFDSSGRRLNHMFQNSTFSFSKTLFIH